MCILVLILDFFGGLNPSSLLSNASAVEEVLLVDLDVSVSSTKKETKKYKIIE